MATPNHPAERPSFSVVAQELNESIKNVVRSEMRLFKTEIKEAGSQLLRYSILLAIFGGIALLGTLPFVAFMVIGLGRILGNNFWLSSLIVAGAMFLFGGVSALLVYYLMRNADISLKDSRESVVRQLRTVDRKLQEVSSTARVKATSHPTHHPDVDNQRRTAT